LFSAIPDFPRITHITTPPLLRTGQNVNLSCTATGLSPLNVTWERRGEVVSDQNNGISKAMFTLYNVTDEDWGECVCVAKNSAGEDRKAVDLRSKLDLLV